MDHSTSGFGIATKIRVGPTLSVLRQNLLLKSFTFVSRGEWQFAPNALFKEFSRLSTFFVF
jgi:hypothetical protein